MKPESSAINIHSVGDVYRGWQNFLVRCWAVIWYLVKIGMAWCQQLLTSLCEPGVHLKERYTCPVTGSWVCLRALSLGSGAVPKGSCRAQRSRGCIFSPEREQGRMTGDLSLSKFRSGTTRMSPTLAFYWKTISLSKFTWVPNLVYNVLTKSFTLKGEFCCCVVWGDSLPLTNGRNVINFSLLC